jgi:hypothetical protein
MRNNVQSLSGTELEGVGHAFGTGLYFSEDLTTARGYSLKFGGYNTSPVFVVEAAGARDFWAKNETGSMISTSLFPLQYHHMIRETLRRPSPHACVVVRGLFMDSACLGAPAASGADRAFFEQAQAAYDKAVGAAEWGKVDGSCLSLAALKSLSPHFKLSVLVHP